MSNDSINPATIWHSFCSALTESRVFNDAKELSSAVQECWGKNDSKLADRQVAISKKLASDMISGLKDDSLDDNAWDLVWQKVMSSKDPTLNAAAGSLLGKEFNTQSMQKSFACEVYLESHNDIDPKTGLFQVQRQGNLGARSDHFVDFPLSLNAAPSHIEALKVKNLEEAVRFYELDSYPSQEMQSELNTVNLQGSEFASAVSQDLLRMDVSDGFLPTVSEQNGQLVLKSLKQIDRETHQSQADYLSRRAAMSESDINTVDPSTKTLVNGWNDLGWPFSQQHLIKE
jgi:hypothetical protein